MGKWVIARQGEVTDLISMELLTELTHRHIISPTDVVVANGGLYSFGRIWELSEEHWDQTVGVDLKGVWITCKVTIPHLLTWRSGKIICTGSTSSLKGLYGLSHYAAAKHGVLG